MKNPILPLPLRLWLAPAVGALLLAACGEDGQSFGKNICPELPLYTWKATTVGSDTTWERVKANGNPLEPSELKAIIDAEEADCITPAGFATNLNSGGSTGAGGAPGPSDAGGD